MQLVHAHGNLLKARCDALVNTVNTVGAMGAGLALAFREAYPAMYQDYRTNLPTIGRMHVWSTGTSEPRLIVNFPTKRHWRDPSLVDYVERGLVDLVEVIGSREISSIAIPPLGCGLGGLDWSVVRPLVLEALEPLPDLTVHLYEPR